MMRRIMGAAALAGFVAAAVVSGAWAQDRTRDQLRDQDQLKDQDQLRDRDQDRIYGSQLMTEQERNEYRSRMRAAKTAEERERIREEHHERMEARAKERGMKLPDEPPAMGGGMMRQEGGMGSGGGRR